MATYTEITDETQLDEIFAQILGAGDKHEEQFKFFWVDRVHQHYPEFSRYPDPVGRAKQIDNIKQMKEPLDAQTRLERIDIIQTMKLFGAELFFAESILKSIYITKNYQKPDAEFKRIAATDEDTRRAYIYNNLSAMRQHLDEIRAQYDKRIVVD